MDRKKVLCRCLKNHSNPATAPAISSPPHTTLLPELHFEIFPYPELCLFNLPRPHLRSVIPHTPQTYTAHLT